VFNSPQTNMQLAQLLLVHSRWGLGQQALSTLCLGESNHVTDRIGTSHQGDQTIQTHGQTTVWRRTVLQRIQQEAELQLCFCRTDIQGIEHFRSEEHTSELQSREN